jgi:hypothetical protein
VNGDNATPDGGRAPLGLADAYEQLRHAATESSWHDGSKLQGLGILTRKGMAAWMNACAAVAPSAAAATVSDVVQVLPNVQRDVVDVLATMALTITPEVMT